MRLTNPEFKRFQELSKKKDSELTSDERAELLKLTNKRNAKDPKDKGKDRKPWGNDFSWWNKYSDLMKDATNIAMNWIPGTGFNGLMAANNLVEAAAAIRISVANVYGAEDKITDPVNMQARNLWLAMHRKYRGLNTYQASDVGAVEIAGIEVLATIAEIERVYGVINYYSINNRNLPYTLLAAMGVNATLANDIRSNLADFRYGLNVLLMRAQNILVPKDLSVVNDKISLYGYIYSDHSSKRAANYVFTSIATARFDATLPGGSAVVFDRTQTIGACTTYQDILDMLAIPIAALVEDDDVNKIYSDMLAYLGNEAFVTVTLLPEAYVTVPVHDESILHKIHNCQSLGHVFNNTGDAANTGVSVVPALYTHQSELKDTFGYDKWAITQKDNVLCTKVSLIDIDYDGALVTLSNSDITLVRFEPDYYVPSVEIDNSLLDTYLNDMDPEHICEGCLFKTGFKMDVAGGRAYYSTSAAFEIICGFTGFINRKGVVSEMYLDQYTYYSAYMSLSDRTQNIEVALQSSLIFSQFDWAPIVYRIVDDDEGSFYFDDRGFDPSRVASAGVVFGMDIDNCRFVQQRDFSRIHESAVLSGLSTTVAATLPSENK